jgi:hypothetical protein
MSVSEDFQQFEQKAGLDRHVIPTGFSIAFVLFSTGMSSLRDFIHSKAKRCFFYNIRYFLQPTRRDDSTKGCGSLRHEWHGRQSISKSRSSDLKNNKLIKLYRL